MTLELCAPVFGRMLFVDSGALSCATILWIGASVYSAEASLQVAAFILSGILIFLLDRFATLTANGQSRTTFTIR